MATKEPQRGHIIGLCITKDLQEITKDLQEISNSYRNTLLPKKNIEKSSQGGNILHVPGGKF